jgi:hypothetical protein
MVDLRGAFMRGIRFLAALMVVGAFAGVGFGEDGKAAGVVIVEKAGPKVMAPAAERYAQRIQKVRANLGEITKAAEVVAQRWVEKKQVLIHSPWGGDNTTFTAETVSRAGGLDNARSSIDRRDAHSANDVILYGPRSWENGGKFVSEDAAKGKAQGWMVVVFGSKAGKPENLAADIVIDNFAPGPGDEEGAVNAIVNCVNVWVFYSELVGALTRRGVRPSVLKGMCLAGASAHNKANQSGKPELFPCETAIPAGTMGRQYLDELSKAMADLSTPERQGQLDKAAGIAVKKIKEGHTVWMASFTHMLLAEVSDNNYAPTKSFRGNSPEGFTKNLQKGDLLFWFGEWTLNLPWQDSLTLIRKSGADYIPSVRLGKEPMEPMEHDDVYYNLKTPDALMVLEQKWPMEAAVVDVPFEPRKMAPVSGIYEALMYRMLDEKIAAGLGK